MKQVLLVFLGGGFGSALRFLISKNLNSVSSIPLGTLLVNFFGSLLIGFILGLGMKQEAISPNTTLLLATGFCGGFTTFSAFSFENQALLKAGDYINFGIYSAGSIFLGIAAVLIGIWLSKLS
ncbi:MULTISPECIES: fluoride efflux transporter CrcB [Salinimicrobium]|uniref:Fluoride-specific ion channel FluC n=1 Tax=Salinimicrobium profundisediminis TaxID=2994553 RepID=A0A9X3I2W8_9FLAO|nr:fluoride efflux transporter CrcB [Salinimicrobium profundisediminis]MCX2839377.1 fluoride efflux transporter CrcB [Salinimicrobium profundisediminis]